jgi:hypothetical protein
MRLRAILLTVVLFTLAPRAAVAQVWNWQALPDPRGEFVRLCAPHMVGRTTRPEAMCLCLHDYALATVQDRDLRGALMRGISENGVPSVENAWISEEKRSKIAATFNAIARPTMQCLFAPEETR